MKHSYITLNGADATWNGTYLNFKIKSRYFMFDKKDIKSITLSLQRCEFIGSVPTLDIVAVTSASCSIVTDMVLENNINTKNDIHVLEMYDVERDYSNNVIKPLNVMSKSIVFDVNYFTEINIGVLFDTDIVDIGTYKSNAIFLLKIGYELN